MHDQVYVATALVVSTGSTSYSYYAGSNIELNRQYGGSNFLQWEIIKHQKKMGQKFYDLGGVPVSPNKSHPAYGVYKFKMNFGGDYEEYFGFEFYRNKIIRILVRAIIKNKSALNKLKKILNI